MRIPSTSPPHLLDWFGWRRLQTAYDYLALGGRNIEEMSNAMRQQYAGKVTETLPEKIEGLDEELKEQPTLSPEPKLEQKSLKEKLRELEIQHGKGELE